MKLGKETGSLVNHVFSRQTIGQPVPEVGMGVTFLGWTDRHPGTIVEILRSGKSLVIGCVKDDYKVVSGSMHDGSAEYEFSTPEYASTEYYKQDRKGTWRLAEKNENGRWVLSSSALRIGEREKYYDPSF